MDEKKLVIRASLRGMLSQLIKLGAFVIIALFFFFRVRRYQEQLMAEYEVGYLSALTRILETEMELMEMGFLIVSYLFAFGMFLAIVYLLYHLVSLLFGLTATTIIDFQNARIIQKALRFPFLRIEDENRFNQLIQVRIEQNLIDGLVEGGTLYVEYLVQSQLDSQLRVMVIPYIKHPDRLKRKMLSH